MKNTIQHTTKRSEYIGTFIKASGEARTMRFTTSAANLGKRGLITVYDVESRGLRRFGRSWLNQHQPSSGPPIIGDIRGNACDIQNLNPAGELSADHIAKASNFNPAASSALRHFHCLVTSSSRSGLSAWRTPSALTALKSCSHVPPSFGMK